MAQKKAPINEALNLDRLFKLVLTGFFGGKILDAAAKRAAVKDPEVKKKIAKVHKSMKDLQTSLQDMQQRYKV
tara:strand:+ start:3161 stop:3379 length:219 start_codon:yes stop_codon:yes gene_type:complete